MSDIQHNAKTLVELLEWRASNQSGKLAYVFLEDGEIEYAKSDYLQLQTRAKSIAHELKSLKLTDERALLIYESGIDYMDSFFGCLYSGVISVPLHPPGKNKSLSRISSIAHDSGAKVILSTSQIRDELEKDFSKDDILKNLKWIATDEIPDNKTKAYEHVSITPDTLAYLQYTSGSTGTPKGVMVNHRNLIHNINIIDKCHPHDDNSVMVSWLPIHHDMGLIYGMLLPFVCGYPCYFMTPQAFVQKPFRWLKAISEYKGTHNAAPNFAFELCVNKITPEQKRNLNLSSWKVAMNAAEPVRSETLQRFVNYFHECGFELKYFAPGYGLAEGTLILSTTLKDQTPVMRRFDDDELEKNHRAVHAKEDDNFSKVHSGHFNSIEDTRIAIVNPVTMIECSEGEVGEVWSSGISIAQGYWKREDATKETFKAHIADTNEGPFLRTGDLGFIKDNELFITGRYKDLIIIRGQNHYPQDIEYTVEASHPALRLGCVAAFSFEESGEEHLGIVQEVQKNFVKDFNADEVFKSIIKSVSDEHDLQVSSITLIKPGTVPKTSSGKIQRRACQHGVDEGSLEVIAEWKHGDLVDKRQTIEKQSKLEFIPTEDKLKEWLISRLSELMQIKRESINPGEPFAIYGIDSLKAVQLSGDIEELLNKEFPATLVYDYPTINQLSKFLLKDYESKTLPAEKPKKSKSLTEVDDIAIIGIGLRFPDANNPEEFWNNLVTGKDSISKIPEDRWDKNLMKKSTVTFGGFVNDVDKFDPVFFGISPREAIQIDPQQRFTLEVAWHALEDAGINPDILAGSDTGVYMGICTYDYSRFSSGRKNLFDVYTGTGTSLSIAANRISYAFDFRGPSVAIDTACSSSLVALHAACQSIKNGESEIALAGGVNLLLSPDWNVVFTEADMLAPDGRCKTFDSSADGYVRSEGCGIVVLKKYSDAVKDGDRIYSVIKGSAINQDGKSNGLTAPNGPSQEEVIKSALENSNISPNEISYLETHGTGTPLGDPIEVNSLTRVLSKDRDENNICYIGSVKTNIGHLEAAAGIAGVIKTSLALFNKEIPKHLHFKNLNPEILIEGKQIRIADKTIEWDRVKRTAGVSSFGFGGTNAHVILQEAPVNTNKSVKSSSHNIFTISAKNENSLAELSQKYVAYLDSHKTADLNDVCYTANSGRASHNHRLALVTTSGEDLKLKLKTFIDRTSGQNIFSAIIKANHLPKVAYLFPGQGAQYIGMGKELYDQYPLFRNTINKCDEILRKFLDKPLLEVLFYEKDENLNPINETTYTQPALFAIEYALAKLWMSWGIEPSVMMGHSAGEYVAACLAGVFSLEDGLKLVTERGRLMQTLSSEGEMYTIFSDEKTVKKAINGHEERVSIASINSPIKTVISGDKISLSQIIPEFDKANIEYRKINVSIASHSPLMNSMISEFRKVCNEVEYTAPNIPVVSNITGEIVTNKISNAEYWCQHILSSVRFSDGIKACVDSGIEFFIDMGPKPTSISMGQETIADTGIHWLPSIKYNFTIREIMLAGLAELYVNGATVNWKKFYEGNSYKKISLPGYPFQKNRYWIEDEIKSKGHGLSTSDSTETTGLTGMKMISASVNETIFNTFISGNNPVFLEDHKVFESIIFPGAAYIEMSLQAISESKGASNISLGEVRFHEALKLSKDETRLLQTIVTKEDSQNFIIKIFSLNENEGQISWTLHYSCKGNKYEFSGKANFEKIKNKFTSPLTPLQRRGEEHWNVDVSKFYDIVKETHVEYGKYFRGIAELFVEKKSALSKIKLSKELDTEGYFAHPVLLDSAFQTVLATLLKDDSSKAFVPVGLKEFNVQEKFTEELWCYAELNSTNSNGALHSADIKLFSTDGKLIASAVELLLKEISKDEFLLINQNIDDWFYEVEWVEQPLHKRTGINDIMSSVENVMTGASQSNVIEKYNKGISRIENLSISYITKSLSRMGFNFEKGKEFTSASLASELKVTKKQEKLFERLLDILTEKGLLNKFDKTYKVINSPDDNFGSEKEIDFIKLTYPETSAELSLVVQCGERLPEILGGLIDPLQVLFPNGDAGLVTNLYFSSPSFNVMNDSIVSAVKNISENSIQKEKIRILEIGAGTGSTAASILETFPEKNIEYTFTDISPSFFAAAKVRFGDYDDIEFKTFNIEKDPLTQGFRENEYDIIVASNVMHATIDLSVSVENAYKILKEDGVMILNEVTQRRNWIDLTFGITEGWWRFEDYNLRKDYPLLSIEGWRKFLIEEGYVMSGVSEAVDESQNTGQSIIIIEKHKYYDEAKQSLIFSEKRDEATSNLTNKSGDILVTKSKNFRKVSENEYEVNWQDRKQMKQLFSDVKEDRGLNIYFVPNEKKIFDEDNIASNCEAIVNLVKAVSERKFEKSPSLNIVTCNSQQVLSDDKAEGLQNSVLWGFGKVINIEHPELNCKLIDIERGDDLSTLKNESNQNSENQIACREGKRFVARLVRKNISRRNEFRADENSTYLITGGFGGLGILSAKYLAEKGAKHIALVGRDSRKSKHKKYLEELTDKGIDVKLYSADVSKKDELKKVFSDIAKSKFKLKGIFHSAGVLDDAVILNQSKEKFENVLTPKVTGSWYLHELSAKLDLDYFVMYSSVASIFGSAGQSNHSAANSFEDSLSYFRRSKGLPSLCINWGIWTGTGSAAAKGADKKEKIPGIGNIQPDSGVQALNKAMGLDTPQVAIFPMNWQKYSEVYDSNFISGLYEKETGKVQASTSEKDDFISKLRNAKANEHKNILTQYFQNLISRIIGLEPDDFDIEQPLNTMGLDSLMAIELKNKVNMELGVDLNLVRYMEETSIMHLVEELSGQVPKMLSEIKEADTNGKASSSEEEKARELLADLEKLSDEELDKLLNESK